MHDIQKTLELTHTIRLLYVEDNIDARESTLEILNEFFETIVIGEDGIDGLEKYNSQKIDLIITDINMPRMNGISMIEEIRKIDKNIPILLLSAYSEIEYFIKSIKLGVDGYLFKPIELSQFIEAISKVSEKIELQDKLSENLNFLQQYQEITDESAIVSKLDLQGNIIHANDKLCELSEYSLEELMSLSQNDLIHPDNDKSIFLEIWKKVNTEKISWKGVLRNISKSAKTYYVDTVVRPILNAEGEILEYIIICHDITSIMSPKKQLFDFIRSSNKPFIFEIKIEYYSDIEKYYSSDVAQQIDDKLYTQLIEFLPEYLEFESFALGNGEYVFVRDFDESIAVDEILASLQSFQRKINDLVIHVQDIAYDISVLMSMAYDSDAYDNVKYGMETLLENKKSFIVANGISERVRLEAQENFDVLKKIKYAIDNDNILSHFQPIVNKDGVIEKYESLVRLVDINHTIITPIFFLDIAKKAQYYTQITRIVLKNSFEALDKTDKDISINLSAMDIEKNQIREDIYKLLELHKDKTHRLIFELLEDENFKDFEVLKSFISKVKTYGVLIAIDDFGSGYSNFIRLLDYQPDIIKLDGSIVKNIESSTFSLSVINSVLLFAKEQKIKVVAEFVENENIYKILKGLGVDYFQGHYFGKANIL